MNPTAANTYNLGTGTANQFNTIYGNALFQNGIPVCDQSGNNCPSSNGAWTVSGGILHPTQSNFLVGLGTTTNSDVISELFASIRKKYAV